MQSGNLRNLRIRKLRTNLEIAQHQCAISRSRGTGAQSRDSAISVACTIEPIEFPSYIKVRDICNKLLQLCMSSPSMSGMYTQTPAPGASGKFANSEKLPSPRSGYGRREIPDVWSAPVQGITISESSQLSSVSQLGRPHPVIPLRSQIALAQSRDFANVLRNSEITQTYCAVSRLAAQTQDLHAISGF